MPKQPIVSNGKRHKMGAYDALYDRPLPASRIGPLFGAFPYPTKIAPETIALFIATHTRPGDTVFDGFAGSGTTGIAALLCADPPLALRQQAEKLGLAVQWGPRKAILCEIGVLGTLVSSVLTAPPNPQQFLDSATELIRTVQAEWGWMYSAQDSNGQQGIIRHIVWSEVTICPKCGTEISIWDGCVQRNPARINPTLSCAHCKCQIPLGDAVRVSQPVTDPLVGKRRLTRLRRPMWLYGSTGTKRWERPVTDADCALISRIAAEPIPAAVPRVKVPWGDLYRSGYHQGLTHLHHFYTSRNLLALAALWERVDHYPRRLRDALRLWLLSYNASHSTIMTRVVAKQRQKDLVVTSAQSGVLYVSGLPVEKNVFTGLRRKLDTLYQAFTVVHGLEGSVDVRNQSSTAVDLPPGSVDYVFTDPPFGANIPYSEVNFINEAWLRKFTDASKEIVISRHQKKDLTDYGQLLASALRELRRILKENGQVSLVFHSATADVWNSLKGAYEDAGFAVERASVLDKVQGSFKQVTTMGGVRGDPVLLLCPRAGPSGKMEGVGKVTTKLIRKAELSGNDVENTPRRLYSRLVSYYLSNQQDVPIDAQSFYRQLAGRVGPNGKPLCGDG